MNHILAIVLTIGLLSGCSPHAYHDEAQIFIKDTENILINNALCSSRQDCTTKQLVKFEAGGWSLGPWSGGGVYISVYQVSSDRVVKSLHSSFSRRRAEMPQVPVYLHVYSTAHGEPKKMVAEYSFQ